jgi:RNA polymerase sigma factor (sigma-70 family)
MELAPHFFRHESARLVAVLGRVFGMHNLALCEDVTQDTLCHALEVWKLHGLPENPAAWLTTAAKNRAIDVLRRQKTRSLAAPELGRLLDSEWTLVPVVEELFSQRPLRDDELSMMFSLCQPRLPEESQIALTLQLSCGFSVDEIAAAFFTSRAAIEKRLSRAKKVVAESRSVFRLEDADLPARLATVQRSLYLLFNEGYHGACRESPIREELCVEAMRLATHLVAHPLTATPSTIALAALLFLHAARLPARVDPSGHLRSHFAQDRSRWNQELAREGLALLDRSAQGEELSAYHVEAGIAAIHVQAARAEDTPWARIVELYDTLMLLQPSAVVSLSRAIAIGEARGPLEGLDALRAIERGELVDYPFYHAALGELSLRAHCEAAAQEHFALALSLARSPIERQFFAERIAATARGSV